MKVNDRDTVVVALRDLDAGETVSVEGQPLRLKTAVRRGHKVALVDIAEGQVIRKYGHAIGTAQSAIGAGAHVHSHNMATSLSGLETYKFEPFQADIRACRTSRTFQGYRRADGRVGTRNDIWIIPTVGCVANVCEQIARRAQLLKPDHIDDVVAITHPQGCSQLGDDLAATQNVLAALSVHPNVGGILFVGLGCENNQLSDLLRASGTRDPARVRTVLSQTVTDEVEAGLKAISELFAEAASDRRETCDMSELVIGLKCGGSDAFSGLTANPMLGRLTDYVCAAGGSAILTEIPEIFGAETALFNRSINVSVFDKAVSVVNGFKQYFLDHDQPVYENPSPGNKEGGITTLEEKSLGAVQKGGHAPLSDVLSYGERAKTKGLNLLESPGNDAVSCTALAAAGATVIIFTTGRGTPLGFPVPTLKVSTHSDLAGRKPNWIDFDAGQILSNDSRDAVDEAFLDNVISVASGQGTANERNGEKSIALWKRGVTL